MLEELKRSQRTHEKLVEEAETLYKENFATWRYFLEWRDKVFTRFFLVLGATMAGVEWLWSTRIAGSSQWLFAPLILASMGALLSYAMDRRNAAILNHCRKVGKRLETETYMQEGFFSSYPENMGKSSDYTKILKYVYLLSFWVLLGLAIIVFLKFAAWEVIVRVFSIS